MKIKQYTSPFKENEKITFGGPNVKIQQIGIEYPNRVPWAFDKNNQIIDWLSTEILVNGEDYSITEREILEWENCNLSIVEITIKKPSPYLIITIAYE